MASKTLLSYSLPYLILCVLVIIFVAIVQYYIVVIQPAKARNTTFVNVTMASYMELVLSRLDSIGESTRTVLSDPALIKEIKEASPDKMTIIENRLKNRLTLVDGVRILSSDTHEIDKSSKPVITNVTLQLLRSLQSRNRVMHEAINAGAKDQYIAVMLNVPGTDKVALIGVSFDVFEKALPKERLVPGYYEFLQSFANQNRTITSMGEPRYKIGDPMGVARLNSTQWRVAFWPAEPESFSSEFELMIFFGGLIMVLGLVAVGGFIGLRNLQTKVRSDATSFLRWLIDSSKTHKPLAMEDFELQIFTDMSRTLTRERLSIAAYNDRRESDRVEQPNHQALADHRSRNNRRPALENRSSGLEVSHKSQLQRVSDISETIFRAYDIRGIVGQTLSASIVKEIGRAIGSEAFERGEQRVIVARDGRLSGPQLIEALKEGLIESGRDVIDIGEVPTPLLYFATNHLDSTSGVMLTGSHNPKDYNGLKVVIAGNTLSGEEIMALKKRIDTGNMMKGQGSEKTVSVMQDYISQVTSDVALTQPLKVAVDCGNGIAGKVVPQLLQALGCEVIGLYCKVDGNFPNHHPDPSKPENLQELIELVKTEKADIGLAFDGDGDRLGVIDSEGNIIWPDRQMMLYSMDVLSRNPGADVIFDVKCTKHLAKVITRNGGHPIMWKTGHSLIKAKMKETGALLAGECSGHIFFKERWFGFDDALYTSARLLEILSADTRKSSDIFAALPNSIVTPEINVAIDDNRKHQFMNQLASKGIFGNGKMISIDGVRIEFPDGWGLVRASNTTPSLVIRFEGESQAIIDKMKQLFKQQMLMIDGNLDLDF
ncbi:MAG: phosphomannomutase/phosphoglucomutase [Enterobacterales bacterium]|nr:phosphomannomutase/phosphoglucomutase [Enterobacterales bacterium]